LPNLEETCLVLLVVAVGISSRDWWITIAQQCLHVCLLLWSVISPVLTVDLGSARDSTGRNFVQLEVIPHLGRRSLNVLLPSRVTVTITFHQAMAVQTCWFTCVSTLSSNYEYYSSVCMYISVRNNFVKLCSNRNEIYTNRLTSEQDVRIQLCLVKHLASK
jgi:hypothetical protein